jgi:hypothetical protein
MSRKSDKYRGSKPVSASGRPLDWQAAAVRKGIEFIGFASIVTAEEREACGPQRSSRSRLRAGPPALAAGGGAGRRGLAVG